MTNDAQMVKDALNGIAEMRVKDLMDQANTVRRKLTTRDFRHTLTRYAGMNALGLAMAYNGAKHG